MPTGSVTASRGLLLVDVDGPLNPYAAKPNARPEGYATFRYTPGGRWYSGRDVRRHKGLRVWLHPGHGAQLRNLAADTGLELVWTTTWGENANRFIGPAIGLHRLPVIPFPPADLDPDHGWLGHGAWKWAAVTDYAAGRPLAWLDDELDTGGYPAARAAFDAARAGTPTLLCTVDARTGLRRTHLDEVHRWAATL